MQHEILTASSTEIHATRYASANAATNERWRRYAGDDEGYDARSGRRPNGHGGDATYVHKSQEIIIPSTDKTSVIRYDVVDGWPRGPWWSRRTRGSGYAWHGGYDEDVRYGRCWSLIYYERILYGLSKYTVMFSNIPCRERI